MDQSMLTALQICDDWRAKLPDGSRMNKAQLFNLLAPQIAKAIDDAANNAASKMRNACVMKVKELATEVEHNGLALLPAKKTIAALQTLHVEDSNAPPTS